MSSAAPPPRRGAGPGAVPSTGTGAVRTAGSGARPLLRPAAPRHDGPVTQPHRTPPPATAGHRPPPPADEPPGGARAAFRVLAVLWLSAGALGLALWFLAGLLGGGGLAPPWFPWVALPAGSVLGVAWLVSGRQRR